MNFRNCKTIAASLVLVSTMAYQQDAYAVKMSTEEFKEYAREEAYWVVSVDCDNGSESRIIQRKTDGDQWCSKDLDGYCYDTKVEAADKVCGNQFSLAYSQVLESQRAQAERQRAEAEREKREQEKQRKAAEEQDRQNQLAVEAELLEIEKQKLSLRKEELALQKRAVEIEEQLKALAE